MIRKIIKLCLIVIWMALIFSFSSDTGDVSTKKSDGVIIRTVEFFLVRDLSESEKKKWTDGLMIPVRKGAHFFVYSVLGFLLISCCGEFGKIDNKLILLAGFLAFLYASCDEIHQLMIPGRSGQISDVALDTVSAFVGIVGYRLIHNKFKGAEIYE